MGQTTLKHQKSLKEKNQKTKHLRKELDFYETPIQLTKTLLNYLEIESGWILECCAGDGAIAKLLRQKSSVIETDLKGQGNYPKDATTKEYWDYWGGNIDLVVTNPPFKEASKILPLAFDHAKVGVAFLLRLSYLEPCKNRDKWLKENADHLRYVIAVSPRPKFRKGEKGTDSVTVAWFVFLKDWSWKKLGVTCPFLFETNWKKPM